MFENSHCFGGNGKFDFMLYRKTGIGIKFIATDYKLEPYYQYSKPKPGLYFLSDITYTHYLIGDYTNSRGGMYFEIGFGYQSARLNDDYQLLPNPFFKRSFTINGLGNHLSIGGNIKIGKGKLFTEALIGGVIYGNLKDEYIYPAGYPGYSSDTSTSVFHINEKGVIIFPYWRGDRILSLNLGYQIYLQLTK